MAARLKKKYRLRDLLFSYLGLLVPFCVVTVFVVVPLVYSVVTSFYEWSYYVDPVFVGFDNYALVLKDEIFLRSIWTVVKFTLIILSLVLVTTFTFALLLRSLHGRFLNWAKIIIYLPTVMSGVVVSLLFSYIFAYDGGIINAALTALGLGKVGWLIEPGPAFASVVITAVWMAFGFNALLLLSGLYDIPSAYYESAQLDGASFLKQTVFITIPLMRNLFMYILVTGSVGYLQFFDLPYMMTGGGPMYATTTPVLMIYRRFLSDPTQNYTVPASLLLFVFLCIISSFIFRFLNSEKSTDD